MVAGLAARCALIVLASLTQPLAFRRIQRQNTLATSTTSAHVTERTRRKFKEIRRKPVGGRRRKVVVEGGMTIVLAGQHPKTDYKKQAQKQSKAFRPNYFKSEHCTADGTCENCDAAPGDANCLSPLTQTWKDEMVLNIEGNHWTKFASVYDLKCPEHIANMNLGVKVKAAEAYRGSWSAYINGVKLNISKKNEIKGRINNNPGKSKGGSLIGSGESAEIRVEFHNDENWQGEVGRVTVKVQMAEQDMACPDNQVCLESLAGVPGGRHLRANNDAQIACLTQQSSDRACVEWRKCLEESGMEAGLTRIVSASQADHDGRRHFRSLDELGCIDPSTSDPEGWTCNCLEAWQEACEDFHQDPDCYKASYCLSDKVCGGWRATACTSSKVKEIWADLYTRHAERLGGNETLVHPSVVADLEQEHSALDDSVVNELDEEDDSNEEDEEEPDSPDDTDFSLVERAAFLEGNRESVDRSLSSKGCV